MFVSLPPVHSWKGWCAQVPGFFRFPLFYGYDPVSRSFARSILSDFLCAAFVSVRPASEKIFSPLSTPGASPFFRARPSISPLLQGKGLTPSGLRFSYEFCLPEV